MRFVDNAGHSTELHLAESQWLAQGHNRRHGCRREGDHHDAASRARLPQRADVVGAACLGGDSAVDAHFPQRARMGCVMAPLRDELRVRTVRASFDRIDVTISPLRRFMLCGPALAAVRVLRLVRVREPARLAGRAGLQVRHAVCVAEAKTRRIPGRGRDQLQQWKMLIGAPRLLDAGQHERLYNASPPGQPARPWRSSIFRSTR